MSLHVPISEDLVSILDRVLDKGIVVDSWIRVMLQGSEVRTEQRMVDAHASVVSTAVYLGYGEQAHWEEDKRMQDLFPYWRRDLWSK
jgi:hypothetical protein